uniref:Uncharacterized protein n=1 Tax=Pararge aegeria TaxID=116150 RepID=S4PWS4_9NEOP
MLSYLTIRSTLTDADWAIYILIAYCTFHLYEKAKSTQSNNFRHIHNYTRLYMDNSVHVRHNYMLRLLLQWTLAFAYNYYDTNLSIMLIVL